MDIINRLPDDIVIHIYTKCLRRYRFHKGVFIKLIDFECVILLNNSFDLVCARH